MKGNPDSVHLPRVQSGGDGDDVPPVCVVVVNWNALAHTRECLTSLAALTYPRYRVVVVDNGSTDGSENVLRRVVPPITVLQTGANLGFAGGSNTGIRFALAHGFEYVWLLNNDTVVQPSALTALVDAAQLDERLGIVGSALYADRGLTRIQAWGGGPLSWLGVAGLRRNEGPVDHVLGASMLIRRAVFDEIGLLDETYFLFLEETDFCQRATQRGWRIGVAPESAVFHKISASIDPDGGARSPEADRLFVRSVGVFLGKQPVRRMIPAVPVRLAAIMIRRLGRRRGNEVPGLVREYVLGVRAGIRSARRGRRPGAVGEATAAPRDERA